MAGASEICGSRLRNPFCAWRRRYLSSKIRPDPSAQALLECRKLIAERLGELRSENREMLLDQRKLGLPAFLVDARHLLHVGRIDLHALDVDGPFHRHLANRRINRLGGAVAALEDPFEHAGVLGVAGPHELAVLVLAE